MRHALVLAKRNVIKTWRTPEQLVDVVLQPIIFLMLFVYVFGGAIGTSTAATGQNTTDAYLEFVFPGIMAQGLVMASIAIGQNLNADIEKGVFDRFRSLPITLSAPLTGAVLADLVRYLTACTVFITVGLLLGYQVETDVWHAAGAVVLAIALPMCFCWISVFVGMKARTPGAGQGVMLLVILPASFASSAYVPVSTMSGGMREIVQNTPITHLVNTVRALMQGGPVVHDLVWTLGWMAGFLAVFMPLAVRAYNRRA